MMNTTPEEIPPKEITQATPFKEEESAPRKRKLRGVSKKLRWTGIMIRFLYENAPKHTDEEIAVMLSRFVGRHITGNAVKKARQRATGQLKVRGSSYRKPLKGARQVVGESNSKAFVALSRPIAPVRSTPPCKEARSIAPK